jgi:hypothetical protein
VESWLKVWREGVAPQLSTPGLVALRDGLRRGDERLLQGQTTSPPPLQCVQDWPVEGACAVGYCGWQGDGLKTVAEVEEFFARVCFETDNRLGEPAACRWFLNWFDDTPWAELKKLLLPEIEREIARREDGNGPEKEIIGGQQSALSPVYELQDRLATHGPLSQQRQGPHLPAVRLGSIPAPQAH